MIIYFMIGFFIISLCLSIWSICTAEVMPDDYDLREEDIWPADEWPDLLDDEESEGFDEDHALDLVLNDMVKDFTDDDIAAIIDKNENPTEPNDKLKEAAKLYKDEEK